jgi:hypothetical protein
MSLAAPSHYEEQSMDPKSGKPVRLFNPLAIWLKSGEALLTAAQAAVARRAVAPVPKVAVIHSADAPPRKKAARRKASSKAKPRKARKSASSRARRRGR